MFVVPLPLMPKLNVATPAGLGERAFFVEKLKCRKRACAQVVRAAKFVCVCDRQRRSDRVPPAGLVEVSRSQPADELIADVQCAAAQVVGADAGCVIADEQPLNRMNSAIVQEGSGSDKADAFFEGCEGSIGQ
jgi:hypothetical protein